MDTNRPLRRTGLRALAGLAALGLALGACADDAEDEGIIEDDGGVLTEDGEEGIVEGEEGIVGEEGEGGILEDGE